MTIFHYGLDFTALILARKHRGRHPVIVIGVYSFRILDAPSSSSAHPIPSDIPTIYEEGCPGWQVSVFRASTDRAAV